jgi:predicted RNA methylase
VNIPTSNPDEKFPFVIYYTKGLGDVVLGEVTSITPDAVIIDQEERFARIKLTAAEVATIERGVRTIDDLRLLVAGPQAVADREGFEALCVMAAQRATDLLDPVRRRLEEPWSVTVSSRNPVWRRSPAWDPGVAVAAHLHGADVGGSQRMPVDLRLQADGPVMHMALNLWDRPLGKRREEGAPVRLGALRPTVAAAMVRIAVEGLDDEVLRKGVYDPFCGTGTIVAEAARLNIPVFASDIDPEAVSMTRLRLEELGKKLPAEAGNNTDDLLLRVFTHDVLRGLTSRTNAPVIVSNLPWGKQVKLDRRTELFDVVAAIVARAVSQGGSCALLTTHEDQLVARIRRHGKAIKTTSRRIGLLGQTPAIVTARMK